MFNAPIWAEYMDTVRVDDKDLRKLIKRSWNAARDKYFASVVSARSYVDVTFAPPMSSARNPLQVCGPARDSIRYQLSVVPKAGSRN